MSDNWIVLIPEDPRHVPAKERQQRAISHFRKIAPAADEFEAISLVDVRFFDCGANFERIVCPSCHNDLPTSWWDLQMEDEGNRNFPLDKRPMPCCAALHTLHELNYEWPQGFGRFAIEAMNPQIGEFSADLKTEFEEILGCRLRVIYQHI